LFKPGRKNFDPKKEMFWSKIFTLLWGVVLIGGAMIFKDSKNPVVELGLSIASFTYGGLLGTFLLGVFFKRTKQVDAMTGFIAGILAMVFVIYYTKTAYTWYVIIGVIVTLITANVVSLFTKSKTSPPAPLHMEKGE
jgi:Na+/proline symporter